jgi:hypothetical protein
VCTSDDKSVQKRIGLVYDPRGAARSNDRQTRSGWGVTAMVTLWAEMIYLNLFYYFMILFQCNNVVILSLIIFCLNYNQHIIDTRYFEILQHCTGLSISCRERRLQEQ